MNVDSIYLLEPIYTLNYCGSQIVRMLWIQITLVDGVNILEIDPLGQELYHGTHLDDKQRIYLPGLLHSWIELLIRNHTTRRQQLCFSHLWGISHIWLV